MLCCGNGASELRHYHCRDRSAESRPGRDRLVRDAAEVADAVKTPIPRDGDLRRPEERNPDEVVKLLSEGPNDLLMGHQLLVRVVDLLGFLGGQ
jgi:hypothetical protein